MVKFNQFFFIRSGSVGSGSGSEGLTPNPTRASGKSLNIPQREGTKVRETLRRPGGKERGEQGAILIHLVEIGDTYICEYGIQITLAIGVAQDEQETCISQHIHTQKHPRDLQAFLIACKARQSA